jgi:5'(3')-deoxyribonucleotidase
MAKPIFFVDMDNTLNDFTAGFVATANQIYDWNLSISNQNLLEYNIEQHPSILKTGKSAEVKERVFTFPGFWRDIPIQDGAAETFRLIYENFETYILTAPYFGYLDCVKEKIEWTQKHLSFFNVKNMIFCNDKHLISKGILIDDHTGNIERWRGEDTKTIMMTYPYNQNVFCDHSARSWKDVRNIVEGMVKDDVY